MIVDSTALPEQAVRDIVASSFQSAGQRCSALRCLYVQEDVAPALIEMLKGAMDELALGDPWQLSTDVGPVIDADAKAGIEANVEAHKARVLHRVAAPETGTFVAPTLIEVGGIADLEREVFGPVLHVATFRAEDIDRVIDDINARGFGLTFGLHTRIDGRVEDLSRRIRVGNAYVNRNQIGAIVGSQPFGGEGLSGTGPKAGGPNYVARFTASPTPMADQTWEVIAETPAVKRALSDHRDRVVSEELLPGPTGELNRLTHWTRPPILCLGPGTRAAEAQAQAVRALGGEAVVPEGELTPEALVTLDGFSGAIWWGEAETARIYAKALAARKGAILPLVTGHPDRAHVCHERHLCVDTTAAGGNADLLAKSAG